MKRTVLTENRDLQEKCNLHIWTIAQSRPFEDDERSYEVSSLALRTVNRFWLLQEDPQSRKLDCAASIHLASLVLKGYYHVWKDLPNEFKKTYDEASFLERSDFILSMLGGNLYVPYALYEINKLKSSVEWEGEIDWKMVMCLAKLLEGDSRSFSYSSEDLANGVLCYWFAVENKSSSLSSDILGVVSTLLNSSMVMYLKQFHRDKWCDRAIVYLTKHRNKVPQSVFSVKRRTLDVIQAGWDASSEKDIKHFSEGQFGKVYSAKVNGEDYAFKLQAMSGGALKEIATMSTLKNNYLLSILNFRFEDSLEEPSVVTMMPLAQGSLRDLIYRSHTEEESKNELEKCYLQGVKSSFETLSWEELFSYSRDILLGLEYLHKNGVIHADLKPLNLLLHEGILKLCDLGSAQCFITEGNNSDQDYPVGTLQYTDYALIDYQVQSMKGNDVVDYMVINYSFEVDIWAFGIIFLEMVTGVCPTVGMGVFDEEECLGRLNEFFFKRNYRYLNEQLPWERLIDSRSVVKTFRKVLTRDSSSRLSASEILDRWPEA